MITELLSPAGSYESFEAAIGAGADAVYVGGPAFGARAYAQNFTQEELITAIGTAHIHNRKLYLTVNTDILIEDIKEEADMLLLPGGMPGTNYLREHEGLADLLKKQYEAGKWVAAICAAPSVFGGLGFLKDKEATSYPGCLDGIPVGVYKEDPVVVDGNVVTSRGVGTAIAFALKLIEVLISKEKAEEIAASIIYSA